MAQRMNRRDLMRAGIAGAGLPGPGLSASGGNSVNGPGFLEPGREVPVAEDCHVIVCGARHEDGVCRVYFNVDVHSPKKEEGPAIAGTGVHAKSHDIPLPAPIARNVKGLLLAGRCISGDFPALAAREDCPPQDLPWGKVEAASQRFGADLL